MSARLSDLLDAARHENFVGRSDQLHAFDQALHGRAERRIMFVHGPGGLGKTTLLMQMRSRARQANHSVTLIEGREVDPSPEGFRTAVAQTPRVLLVDGYEQLGPIDAWIRETFVPELPADTVVVIAGREPPSAPWRTDPGWRRIVGVHRLELFDDTECAELLTRAGVAVGVQPQLKRLGRGHPLAMAMLADVAGAGPVPDTLAEVPDLVTALLETLLRDAPTPAHVAGLAACARAWLTTEDLLRDLVGAQAPQVWAWLRQRPFIACGPRGLWPHDLVRDVLDAEFERRFPERYKEFHRVVHDHVVAGLRRASGPDRQLLAQHLIYLHRRSPLTKAFAALRSEGSAALAPARPDDLPHVYAMGSRALTPTSRGLLEAWAADQPGTISVVRTAQGLASFACNVTCPSGSTLENRDPVVRAILDHVAATAPARPGEQITICRFLLGVSETGVSERELPAVLAGSTSSVMEWVSKPLAWAFIAFTDIEFYAPFFDYLGFSPQFDIVVDGLNHRVYGLDWRRLPLPVWLELMNEREHSGGSGPAPAHLLRPPPLDRATFAAAVRTAMQDLARPDRLATSPLAFEGELRDVLVSAVDAVGREPKGEVLRSVLVKTFVKPAATQEAAAAALNLPFSTYRRHLARALDHLVDLLWAVEINELSEQRLGKDRSGD